MSRSHRERKTSRTHKLKKAEFSKLELAIESNNGNTPFKFVDSTNKHQKNQIAESYANTNNGRSLMLAGDMFIELASDSKLNSNNCAAYLDKAHDCWKRSMSLNSLVSSTSIRSANQLANFDSYVNLLLYQRSPSLHSAEKTYSNIVDLCSIANNQLRDKNSNSDRSERKIMIGLLSELSITALLYRFSLKEDLRDNIEWSILPSFLSEDTGVKLFANDRRNSWDISIYSHYESSPELLYKIQSKTSDKIVDPYTDEIAVVYLNDIGRSDAPTMNLDENIAALLYREQSNELSATNRLDEITERLLEEIDKC
jgi:hypothetical protein